jgi:ATP-dependent helicase/nuclease subunit B
MFPGPAVLAAYRVIAGKAAGDQADLLAWLGPPASFAPARPEGCLDETEWWLWRLCGGGEVDDPAALVAAHFPHLGRGLESARQRAGEAFTAFDGLVPEAGRENDPLAPDGPVMSSRRLETLGGCPRAYFFQYLLGVRPPEELVVEPGRWLDPLASGALLHEVFEEFFAGLALEGRPPQYSRDWPRLRRILGERVRAYRHRVPPPHESAFRQECRELEQVARVFLLEEEEYGRDGRWRPAYLEAAVGLPGPGRGTALDSPEPVLVALPGGRQMRTRALIDRLDRLTHDGVPTFAVWDYKTGSTWKYSGPDPFRQGRVVQNALYPLVAEARLREAVSPVARVAQVGFFFPGGRGRGERLAWATHELPGAGDLLLGLCRVAARGAFPATDDAKTDCTYCPYQMVCGDVEAEAAGTRAKLNNPANKVLQPFLRLRTDR